jgi:hypothetical protein
MDKLIIIFVALTILISCEKEIIEPPKAISVDLPTLVKSKVDSTKIDTTKKKKKRNRKFFLKKT